MEETGAMARDSLYIYYLSAATMGIWRVNSIKENFLRTSQLPSVYQFYIASGTMKPAGTGISEGYVDKKSRFIDIRAFGR
jgi:hypothetical protein